MNQMRSALPLVCTATALALCGCAAVESRAMVPPPLAVRVRPPLRGAIALVKVGGGQDEPGLAGWSRVKTPQLEEALRTSLDQSGFLARPGEKPAFAMEAFLVELKTPSGGFTLKVDSFIRYKVTSNDGKIVFDDIVIGTCTKTMDDAFVAGERMSLAMAGAVRDNISTLLLRLDSLYPEEGGR